jgi:hypothetical protein
MRRGIFPKDSIVVGGHATPHSVVSDLADKLWPTLATMSPVRSASTKSRVVESVSGLSIMVWCLVQTVKRRKKRFVGAELSVGRSINSLPTNMRKVE